MVDVLLCEIFQASLFQKLLRSLDFDLVIHKIRGGRFYWNAVYCEENKQTKQLLTIMTYYNKRTPKIIKKSPRYQDESNLNLTKMCSLWTFPGNNNSSI